MQMMKISRKSKTIGVLLTALSRKPRRASGKNARGLNGRVRIGHTAVAHRAELNREDCADRLHVSMFSQPSTVWRQSAALA
jgi:hypothetical protein